MTWFRDWSLKEGSYIEFDASSSMIQGLHCVYDKTTEVASREELNGKKILDQLKN
jgi:hypothetical protein